MSEGEDYGKAREETVLAAISVGKARRTEGTLESGLWSCQVAARVSLSYQHGTGKTQILGQMGETYQPPTLQSV